MKHNEECTSNVFHRANILSIVEKYESLLEPLVTKDEKPYAVCANIMRILVVQLEHVMQKESF